MSDEKSLRSGGRTSIMAIINVTPDSFSGDGLHEDVHLVASRTAALVEEGADIIDIGGESTRPGYTPVPVDEELRRVIPAIAAAVSRMNVLVSVDTSKARVAHEALRAGATIVNDVSGLKDPDMVHVVASADASLVLVHNGNQQTAPDLMTNILKVLDRLAEDAVHAGVNPEAIFVDPGIGIGKGWRENLEIIRQLPMLRTLGMPILVGPSRKGMIGRVLGLDVTERLEGTAALVTLCIAGGADIVRVHDVKAMSRVARMTDAVVRMALDFVETL